MRILKPYKLMLFDNNTFRVLFVALMSAWIGGCAHTIKYDSYVGESGAIPAKANITFKFNEQNLEPKLKNRKTKQSIIETVTKDLEENLFSSYGNTIDAIIFIDKISYEKKRLIGQYVADSGFGLWLLGLLTDSPYDGIAGSLALTVSVFLPRWEYNVESNTALEIRKNDKLVGRYRSTGESSNIIYWLSSASDKDLYSESLKQAFENIKKQTINDKQTIIATISKKGSSQFEILDTGDNRLIRITDTKLYETMKINIGVLDLDAVGISVTEGLGLSHRLRFELINTGRFTVLEREQMNEILLEQGFQQTGCTTTECVVQAGRILNVDDMVAGSVSKLGDIYSIQLRLVDVQTGEITREIVVDMKGTIGEILTKGMKNAAFKIAH